MRRRTLSVLLAALSTTTLTACTIGADELPAFAGAIAARATANELIDEAIEASHEAGEDPFSMQILERVLQENLGDLDPEVADVPAVSGMTDDDGDGIDDDRRFQVDIGSSSACATVDETGEGVATGGACEGAVSATDAGTDDDRA